MEATATQKCGCCDNRFQTPKHFNYKYEKECCVCHITKPIKYSCAQTMYLYQVLNQNVHSKNATPSLKPGSNIPKITPEQFKSNLSLNLFCRQCQQKECFLCKKKHTQGYIKAMICEKCSSKWSYVVYTHTKNKSRKKQEVIVKGCIDRFSEEEKNPSLLCSSCCPTVRLETRSTKKQESKSPPMDSAPSVTTTTTGSIERDSVVTASVSTDKDKTTTDSNVDVKDSGSKSDGRAIQTDTNIDTSTEPEVASEDEEPFELCRYKNNNNKDFYQQSEYLLKIDNEDKQRRVLHLFEKCFKLNDEEFKDVFDSMVAAKDHFYRKFGFLQKTNKDGTSVNIFNISSYPQYIQDRFNMKTTSITNTNRRDTNINLYLKSIESLFNKKWLNDEIIELMLQTLALYSYNQREDPLSIQSTIVGSVLSNPHIVPNKDKYPDLLLKDDEDEGDKTRGMKAVKQWYCKESKGLLTKQLDILHNLNIIPEKYVTILNIENYHWVVLEVSLTIDQEQKKVKGEVKVYDSYKKNSFEIVFAQSWFAKYFWLFASEQLGNTLETCNFFCQDIMRLLKNFKMKKPISSKGQDIEKEKDSLLAISSALYTFQQKDGHNCGILAILQAVDLLTKSEHVIQLRDSDSSEEDLNHWRLRILQFIQELYHTLHGDEYAKCKAHTYMNIATKKGGILKNAKDFAEIHQLFESGQYQLAFDSEGNCTTNANTVHEAKIAAMKNPNSDITDESNKISLEGSDTEESRSGTKKRRTEGQPKDTSDRIAHKKQRTKPGFNEATHLEQCRLIQCCALRVDFTVVSNAEVHVISPLNDLYNKGNLSAQEEKIYKEKLILHPTELVKKLEDLFVENYVTQEKSTNVRDHIQLLMKTYNTYFLMDYKTGPGNKDLQFYDIAGAFIIEKYVELPRNIKIHIVHAIALNGGFHYRNYLQKLFQHLVNKEPDMLQQNIYVIRKLLGKKSFKQHNNLDTYIKEELIDMGFHSIEQSELDILEEFTYGCHSMYVNKGYKLPKNIHEDTDSTECRLIINNLHKVKFKYEETDGKFYLQSHAFGWSIATQEELAYFRGYQTKMKRNPGKEYTFGGGGARSDSTSDEHMKDQFTDIVIEEKYRQTNYFSNNNCVWLGVAVMLQNNDEKTGELMLQDMLKDPKKYDWMTLMKEPKRHDSIFNDVNNRGNRLSELLKKHTDYNVCKINKKALGITSTRCYLEYLLNKNTRGMYVCMLEDNNGDRTHSVAINCNKHLVFDSMNHHAMKSSKETFDYCVGSRGEGLKRIPLCYEIKSKKENK